MLRTPPALALVLALALQVGGCSCEGEPAAPAPTAVASAPAVPASYTIAERPVSLPEVSAALDAAAAARLLPLDEYARLELVSPGEAPFARYRYTASPGERLELAVEAAVALSVETDSGPNRMPVPSLRIALVLEVEAVTPRIRFAIQITGIALRGADEIAAEMRSVVKRLEGARSVMEMTDRGAAHPPPPPTGSDPAMRQLWSTIAEALASAVIPLPEAAIGTGARYRVVDRVRRAGVVMLRLNEVTASPGPEGFLALDATVREVPLAEGARDPALPPDVRLEVVEGLGAGTRRVAISAGEPLPRVAASEIATDLTIRAVPTKLPAEPETTRVTLTQLLALARADNDAERGALDAGAGGAHGLQDAP